MSGGAHIEIVEKENFTFNEQKSLNLVLKKLLIL